MYLVAQAQHSSLDRISIDGAVLPWGHTLNYSGTLNYEFIKTNHIGVYWKNWFEPTHWSGTGEREQSLGLIYTSNLIDKKWFLDIRFAIASQAVPWSIGINTSLILLWASVSVEISVNTGVLEPR